MRMIFLALSLALPLAGCPLGSPDSGPLLSDPGSSQIEGFGADVCVTAEPALLIIERGETEGMIRLASCTDEGVVMDAIEISEDSDRGLGLHFASIPPLPSQLGSWPLTVTALPGRDAPLVGAVEIWVRGRELPRRIPVVAR